MARNNNLMISEIKKNLEMTDNKVKKIETNLEKIETNVKEIKNTLDDSKTKEKVKLFIYKFYIWFLIIRINTILSNILKYRKLFILPRIYHDWMSLDMTQKQHGR